jgi:putative ABC transport system substrate-binding protein
MRRREFVGLATATATFWPLKFVRAQQSRPARQIGVIMNYPAQDPEGQLRIEAFLEGMRRLGWNEGGNLHTEIRWAGDDAERYPKYAKELVEFAPDVILASASPSVAALQTVTQVVPIVFASVIDPVGAGFVRSLSRPGGNTTGFIAFEYSISAKWLELLRELEPGVRRVAVIREASLAAGIGQFAAIQTTASSSSGLELTAIDSHNPAEIKRALAAFAEEPNGGLIVTASSSSITRLDLLLSLATQYRLPTVCPFRYFAVSGALASYGPNFIAIYASAAEYVDRILKGEKPADLPVQAPTGYQLVLNLKTAKTLGLSIPPALLARADEVIE